MRGPSRESESKTSRPLPWCRLPWEGRYALRPVETFCKIPRFDGTCYQAANWTGVGCTQGRGKLDVRNGRALPVASRRDWTWILNK